MLSPAAASWSVWAFLIGGILVGLIGLAVFIRAMIGDRANGRRRCPRCWYDLSQTEGLRCSECGHEAKRERQLFKTRRRWRMAAIGVLLMLAAGGGLGWQQTRAFDWNTVKPVWWLLAEADGPSQRAVNARKEFVRRLQTNQLSDAQVNRVVERALAAQADPNAFWSARRWGDSWGDVVEEAWDQERLRPEQIERYVRQAFDVPLFVDARAKIRQGESIPARLGAREPRLSMRRSLRNAPSRLAARANWVLRARAEVTSVVGSIPLGLSGFAGAASNRSLLNTLPPGSHELTFVFDAWVLLQPEPGTWRPEAIVELARWETMRTITVEVVPSDEPTVRLIADESLRQPIIDAIRSVIEGQFATAWASAHGRPRVIPFDPVPVNLSFDVFARVGEVEHQIGAIAVEANQSRTNDAQRIETHPRTLFPDAEACDLILRASPAGAERTIDIFEAWDGEIVIKDVPLKPADSE